MLKSFECVARRNHWPPPSHRPGEVITLDNPNDFSNPNDPNNPNSPNDPNNPNNPNYPK